jgi:NitT/TauT family transport system permease protein
MAETGVIASRAGGDTRPAKTATAEWSMAQSVLLIRVVTIIGAIAAWEGLAALGRMDILYGDVIPSTWKIAVAIWEELVSATFYNDLRVTGIEVGGGFVIGSAIALALGILMGTNKLLREALEPYLNAIGSTPKIIFLPILFLMFGTGIESKIAKGALSAFFPVVFSTVLGMILIPPVLIRVGRSFNLTKWQMVSKIYLPAMVNPIITGMRLGIAIAIIGVLVAELKFADSGLGYRVAIYYEQFRIAPMYAIIILIFAIAAFVNVVMTLLQDRINRRMTPTTSKNGSVRPKASGGLGLAGT